MILLYNVIILVELNITCNYRITIEAQFCIIKINLENCSNTQACVNKQVCDFYDGYNRDVILEIINNVTIRKHYLIHKESGTVMQMTEYKLNFENA